MVKPIIFFAMCVFCKMGYSQEMPEVQTYYIDTLQRIVVLSGDTVCDVIKEFNPGSDLVFSDASIDRNSSELIIKYRGWMETLEKRTWVPELYTVEVRHKIITRSKQNVNIDSILSDPEIRSIYHFEKKIEEKKFKKVRHVVYFEIRHTTTILSEKADTIFNLFANEKEDVFRDVFFAQVKTSYLINVLEQNGLLVQSDSLWIMVIPGRIYNNSYNKSSQYYIYQYCGHSQTLYLSVISFAQGHTPTIVYSDSTRQLNRNEIKNINRSIDRFHNHQVNCINSSYPASLVLRSHGKYSGIFQSFRCDIKKRGFGYGFIPIRNIQFRESPLKER
jgi:hypothetical protein